ncbi:hypothetical protein AB0J43_10810 [Nonomuraea fuscirosea]
MAPGLAFQRYRQVSPSKVSSERSSRRAPTIRIKWVESLPFSNGG